MLLCLALLSLTAAGALPVCRSPLCRRVLLTPERNCSLCFKRVGTSALVAFPSGLLAHYSCYRRTSGGGSTSGSLGAGGLAAGGGGRA